jgi:hypothetical protein
MLNSVEKQDKSLHWFLNLGVWTLDLTAWICTGHEPDGFTGGFITRIADGERIYCGSFEFREAEKEKNRILKILKTRVADSMGVEFEFELHEENEHPLDLVNLYERPNHHFDRNWLIDLVTNGLDEDDRIELWWLEHAIEMHFVPAFIKPDVLSAGILKERGAYSFLYPRADAASDVINAPTDEIDTEKIEGVGTLESVRLERDSNLEWYKGKTVKVLFRRTPESPTPKNPLYCWIHNLIDEQINLVPEEQFWGFDPIEGWDAHCRPRPTGLWVKKYIRNMSERLKKEFAIQFPTAEDPCGDRLGDYYGQIKYKLDGHYRYVSVKNLNKYIRDWFCHTDSGLEYREHLKNKRSSLEDSIIARAEKISARLKKSSLSDKK